MNHQFYSSVGPLLNTVAKKKQASEESDQVTGMKTCVANLIKGADWSKENDGGCC